MASTWGRYATENLVGSRNEHDPGEVERCAEVVVVEAEVLLWI